VFQTASEQDHGRSAQDPIIGRPQEQVKGSRMTTGLQLHGQALEIILFVHINANLAPLTASHSRA
jgi:hypothetical protein